MGPSVRAVVAHTNSLVVALHILLSAAVALRGYPATQDGPSHLYAARVLWSLSHDQHSPFVPFFASNLRPQGNSLFFLAGSLVSTPCGLEQLSSLTIFLALAGLPLAAMAFASALRAQPQPVDGRAPPAVAATFLACPLAFNYFLYRGFFNFVLAVPLSIGCLAAVLFVLGPDQNRNTALQQAGAIIASIALATLSALAHPAALVFLLAAIPAACIRGPVIRRVLGAGLVLLLLGFAWSGRISSDHPPEMHFSSPASSVMQMVRVLGVTHSYAEALPALLLFGLLAWGASRALGSPGAMLRSWQTSWPAVAATAMMAAYFVVPFEFGGAAGLNERIPLLAAMLILPYIPLTGLLRRLALPGFLLFAAYTATASVLRDERVHSLIDTSAADAIPKGSLVYPVTLQLKLGSVSADLGRHLLLDIGRRRDLVMGSVFCGHPAHPIRCLPALAATHDAEPIQDWEHASDDERRRWLADPNSPLRLMFSQIVRNARVAQYLLVLGAPTLDGSFDSSVIKPLGAVRCWPGGGAVRVYALPRPGEGGPLCCGGHELTNAPAPAAFTGGS